MRGPTIATRGVTPERVALHSVAKWLKGQKSRSVRSKFVTAQLATGSLEVGKYAGQTKARGLVE
jgi:hypothetical protein